MKLTVCPTCQKACALCGQPLHVNAFCPPCAGRQGGSSRSQKKTEASRQNLEQSRLLRRRRRRERGQVLRG